MSESQPVSIYLQRYPITWDIINIINFEDFLRAFAITRRLVTVWEIKEKGFSHIDLGNLEHKELLNLPCPKASLFVRPVLSSG
jgi:hypothetical protein